MKILIPTISFIILGSLVSCQQPTPAAPTNPYGAPAVQPQANPYGAPLANGETGTYNPNTAPPQPIPGVTQGTYTPAPIAPAAPDYTQPSTSATASSHTVVSGDSLWGLAKRYNTTIEDIQLANGLTTTLIRTGQVLQIPSAQ